MSIKNEQKGLARAAAARKGRNAKKMLTRVKNSGKIKIKTALFAAE